MKIKEDEKEEMEEEGRKKNWSLMMKNLERDNFEKKSKEVNWEDMVRGKKKVDIE